MFFHISTHFTAPHGVPLSSPEFKLSSIKGSSTVKPWDYTPTCALRPVIPINACTLRITAAAGTELAGASFGGTITAMLISTLHVFPSRQRFTIRRPSSLTRRCCVRLSPIAQYSPLLPPVGVWTVFQFQCGRSSSQIGYPSSPWWAVTPPTS